MYFPHTHVLGEGGRASSCTCAHAWERWRPSKLTERIKVSGLALWKNPHRYLLLRTADLVLLPAHDFCLFAEYLPLHVEAIFTDEAMATVASGDTALAGALAVLPGMRVHDLICHFTPGVERWQTAKYGRAE